MASADRVLETDFAGRSLDCAVDPSMTGYLGLLGRFQAAMENVGDEYSPPDLIAEVVWTTATDGNATMRYRVGADAEAILTLRANATDDEVMAATGQRFRTSRLSGFTGFVCDVLSRQSALSWRF